VPGSLLAARRAGPLPAGEAPARFFIGVAGWSLPAAQKPLFGPEGSHLERYAAKLGAVEINSSFYRHHRADTYARWAASVPAGFRFSVKLARAFTHEARLAPDGGSLRDCLRDIGALGEKWGALLVQLPPSLAFDPVRAERLLDFLAAQCPAPLAWEPRHRSWSTEPALLLLERYGAARVIADPDPAPPPRLPASDDCFRYYRLHGSPDIYRSAYRAPFLTRLAASLHAAKASSVWCVFDNTTFGFALENALALSSSMSGRAEARIVS